MSRLIGTSHVVVLLGSLSLAACVNSTPLADEPGAAGSTALPPVRRLVTIENADGGVTVLADDDGAQALVLNGTRLVRLWETRQLPVPLAIDKDAGAAAGNAYRDGFVGTSFYLAEIPPGSNLSDIPIHKQDSLDYIAVLEGEIDLVLPDRVLTMRRGETLVQAGNLHSWVNSTDVICRLLVVVLSGQR